MSGKSLTNRPPRSSRAKTTSPKSSEPQAASAAAPASMSDLNEARIDVGARTGSANRSAAPVVPSEERRRLIELSAYYRAERRGFTAGSATDDWLAAEIEIDRL